MHLGCQFLLLCCGHGGNGLGFVAPLNVLQHSTDTLQGFMLPENVLVVEKSM